MIKSSLMMNISERLLPPYNNPHDVELSPLPPILPIIASHNYRSCTCQKPLHSVHTNTQIQNTQIHSHNIPKARVCRRTLHIVHTPAHFTLYISHISPFSAISYFNDSIKFWGWCPTYSEDIAQSSAATLYKTNCTKISFLLNAAQYCIVWRRNEIKQSVFVVTLAQMYNVVQRHCCTNAHLAQCNLVS